MDPHALSELEFPRVLELVAALAASDPGRLAVAAIRPTPFPGEVATRLDETDEMTVFLQREGRLELSGLLLLDDTLEVLSVDGSILTPFQFRQAFEVISCLIRLRRRLLSLAEPLADERDRWPILRERGRLVADLTELDRLRARLFDAEGELRDDASPELSRIRRAIAARRSEVEHKANSILRSDPSMFQDTTVVQRAGRWCLPLRAEARGRLSGILHERSQSGATLFVEPMAIVEINNDIASLREEESEEVRRILLAATAALAARRDDLQSSIELSAGVDALQARGLFALRSDAIRPLIGAGRRIELREARHPLLDERLAGLRRQVFGEPESREKRRVVPVDIVFEPQTRVLLLTGPNAGGKTATLKVIGLFAVLAQSGFFIPAGSGSSLPVFDSVTTHVGDAQDLLSDLSSFSSYMRSLAHVLPLVGPGSLVLLDELGSATDPDEGGALAAAVLEQIASAGGTAAVTTHLGFLKNYSSQNPAFAVAAMEYDTASGQSTFRVLPGLVGRSFALPLAERAGVPGKVLDRARALLGEGWVAREQAEAALEKARVELERERLEAARARREREEERDRLEKERLAAAEAARRDRLSFRREMDRLKRVVDESLGRALSEFRARLAELAAVSPRAVEREVERMRAAILAEARGVEAAAVGDQKPAVAPGRPLREGDRVKLEGLGSIGILRSIGGAKGGATIEVGGKTMKVDPKLLVAVDSEPAAGTFPTPRASHRSYEGSRGEETVAAEIHLLGKTVDEAVDLLDDYLDRALLSGRSEVRVIHGFGTGKLRTGVLAYLKKHRAVVSTRPGEPNEGGGGATIVTLDA